MFKLGDKVMLNPDKDEFTYGKGPVLYTDVGEINSICKDGDLCVNFPSHTYWRGKEDDLVLYEEMESNIVIPDDDTLDYVQTDINLCKQYDEIFNKEREEKDMNKVLKLYYDRKLEEIHKKYEEKVDNDFNNIDVVKQYKTLIENFEKEQEALFKTVENFDNDYLVPSYDSNLYKYSISELKTRSSLMTAYENDRVNEIEKLKELVEEVDAQLSLSDDLNYQMEVLTRYDILDKKTNKVKA